MKIRNIIISFALAATLLAGSLINPIDAKAEGYTYRVKIHLADSDLDGDNKGDAGAAFKSAFDDGAVSIVSSVKDVQPVCRVDGDTFIIENLSYGAVVSFDVSKAITVATDETGYTKYFAKGIRQSGSNDFDKKSSTSSFTVTKDLDYVVAYSVGNIVPYMVRYVDEAGNKLYEDQIMYGPENEPVSVSYKYFEGYAPNTYNYYTKQLAAPVKDNDGAIISYTTFEFTYSKASANTVITDTVYENGGVRYVYVDGGPEYVTVPGQAGAAAAGGAGGAGGADDNAVIADDQVPEAGPAEVIDIDEEKTPLSGAIKDNAVPFTLAVIAIIAATVIFVLVMVLLSKKKKKAKAVEKNE